MWTLRTGTPRGVYGHLVVAVMDDHPLHRYYGKKFYLCLHCLRLSRKYTLFYNRLCEPSDGTKGCRFSHLAEGEKMSPGLRELVKGGMVVERRKKTCACAEKDRPARGWPSPARVGTDND